MEEIEEFDIGNHGAIESYFRDLVKKNVIVLRDAEKEPYSILATEADLQRIAIRTMNRKYFTLDEAGKLAGFGYGMDPNNRSVDLFKEAQKAIGRTEENQAVLNSPISKDEFEKAIFRLSDIRNERNLEKQKLDEQELSETQSKSETAEIFDEKFAEAEEELYQQEKENRDEMYNLSEDEINELNNWNNPDYDPDAIEETDEEPDYNGPEYDISDLENEDSIGNEAAAEIATELVLEKLKAAGIEVVTDKEEFNRILEREQNLQKMAGTLTSEEQKRYFTFNDEETRLFRKQVEEWQEDKSNVAKLITVGKIPPVMKVLGFPDNPIEIQHSTLSKAMRPIPQGYPDDEQGHNLTIDDIYSIPEQLADPVMVFKSRTRSDSYVFFTERKDFLNRTILIPMAVDKQKGRIRINEITSMYGRNNEVDFVKSNLKDNLIYVDKKRSTEWERSSHVQFVTQRLSNSNAYDLNILTKERLVNFISADSQEKTQVQKMTTLNGEVYGFAYNGEIYVDKNLMDSNVLAHEYTHLWDNYTKNTNQELWERGKNVFKQTNLWSEVADDPNYQNIKENEDEILSECHARICGKFAQQVLERIAAENGENAKNAVVDWDREANEFIAKEFGFAPELGSENYISDSIKAESLKEFLATPMKDLMAGRGFKKQLEKETLTFEEAQKRYPNIVDLSEEFSNPAPTEKEVLAKLRSMVGGVYATATEGKSLQIKGDREKLSHIFEGDNYIHDNNKTRKTNRRLAKNAEKLIHNAKFIKPKLPDPKKNKDYLLGMHNYEVPVFVNGHGFMARLEGEVIKNAPKFSPGNKTLKKIPASGAEKNAPDFSSSHKTTEKTPSSEAEKDAPDFSSGNETLEKILTSEAQLDNNELILKLQAAEVSNLYVVRKQRPLFKIEKNQSEDIEKPEQEATEEPKKENSQDKNFENAENQESAVDRNPDEIGTKNAAAQGEEPEWKRKIDNLMEMAKAEENENKQPQNQTAENEKTGNEQSQENSSEIKTSNSSLEQTSLENAADLLKNISFNSENYKELVDVINKITKMSGKEKIQVPSEEEIKNEEKITEINPESEQTQNQENETVPNEISSEESNPPENQNEQNQNKNILSDENEKIIYGKTILPDFSVLADGKLQPVKNAVVTGYDKESKNYLLNAGGEKIELPSETFKTLFNDKIEQEKEQIKVAEGRAIVFEDKERGIKGTVLPEFSMITQNGIKSYKDCVVQSFNPADKTYTLSNGDTTLSVSEERFKEISSEERFENKFDENTPAYKKLLQTQYNDYFKQRDNTSYNFRHNLSVYCRKEASSPLDALRLAKDIVSRMSGDERKKTKSLLKKMRHENESINELIVRTYHEAIKEVPLNEDYIKKFQPENVIARPFYDTISDKGKPVDNDNALVKGEKDRNLKIGDMVKNVDFSSGKLFGLGKSNVHFDELKVISASKEGNSITLMDKNKSYFKLPRDTFLEYYKTQQLKEMKIEQRNARRNSMSLGYA